jgi:hypothetical protein
MVHGHIPMTSNVSSTPPRTHLRVASQNACLPLSSLMPPLPPPLFNHARGRSHEAFRKRRACRTRPHMHVRAAGALSREAVCGATGERVLATPVSRRPLE